MGKTTLIKELAERLDLVHVNSLFIVNEILEKSLKHIQDLEEWDEEENGPKPDPLTEFERSIVNKLYSGYDLNNED